MWFKIVFTHRRSGDPRGTFGSEQTTRSLERDEKTHTQRHANISQSIKVIHDIFNLLDSRINHNIEY